MPGAFFVSADDQPHPALQLSLRVYLPKASFGVRDYRGHANPPILHRKEFFLLSSNPMHAKFARLTAKEEKHGLLDNPSGIGTRDGWARRLSERGFCLKGHRLVSNT